jgi:glycosidase
VTSSDYTKYNKAATLVKITELMMPGTTYIYYGDEIGMTGNFPAGMTRSDYSDLWYRQPMKWKQDGTGRWLLHDRLWRDGIRQDRSSGTISIRRAVVEDATSQAVSASSTYAAIAKFANLKSSSSTLIRGDFVDAGSSGNLVKFTRSLNGDKFDVMINFANFNVSVSHNGTVVATY